MSNKINHDQNFKNLILDYPYQALEFFACDESTDLTPDVRITPIRQEQLKERLGDRFHELDVPLLVEWPDGRKEALLFVLEEETDPKRFSIHRLAHYTLHLSELFNTQRVVPVVIFLHSNEKISNRLQIQSNRHLYLEFNYLQTKLDKIPASQFSESQNLIARLNLPNMQWSPSEKIDVYAKAIQGLLNLESDPEKRLKYIDFVNIYADFSEEEIRQYQARYEKEGKEMASFAERFRNEGKDLGIQQGLEQGLKTGVQLGIVDSLNKLIHLKFGSIPAWAEEKISNATQTELDRWLEQILTAESLEDLLN